MDERKLNEIIVSDNQHIPPIQELIQKSERVKYTGNMDRTTSFLQIPLNKNFRKYKYKTFLYIIPRPCNIAELRLDLRISVVLGVNTYLWLCDRVRR
jgi:hypothetical protein